MNLEQYLNEALRTAGQLNRHDMMVNGVMGLAGEAGECLDLVKKYLYQGHQLGKDHLAKELGDVAWYLVTTAHSIGYDLETILQMNVDKLRKRYPTGFDSIRSEHREEGDL